MTRCRCSTLRYMRNTLQGDFGNSLRTLRPVTEDLARRVPRSVRLGVAAFLLSMAVGIPLGVLAAIKRGTWIDGALMVVALVGVSVPNFWFAYVLILIFGLYIPILPPSGLGGIRHMILPSIVLGLSIAGALARYSRSSMLEVINHDYVRTARAKGVAEFNVMIKHALRNGLIPIVTILGINFGFISGRFSHRGDGIPMARHRLVFDRRHQRTRLPPWCRGRCC